MSVQFQDIGQTVSVQFQDIGQAASVQVPGHWSGALARFQKSGVGVTALGPAGPVQSSDGAAASVTGVTRGVGGIGDGCMFGGNSGQGHPMFVLCEVDVCLVKYSTVYHFN